MSTPSTVESHQSTINTGSIVPGGHDRVSSILALRPLLGQFGVDLDTVLAESGLPANQFDNPENLIPFREGSRLLGMCVERTACAHLGLLIGKFTPLESLGMLADLAKSAKDVRDALLLMSRFLTLSDGGGLLTLSEDANLAMFSYAIYEPGVEHTEIVYDTTLATSWNILRALCGNRWVPHEVLFTRSRPADLRPYRNFFRAPLRFDTGQSAIVFKREWLGVPLATSDPAALRLLESKARDLESRSTADLLGQIRRILRRQLLSGASSMQLVADELAMHRRTLDRRLSEVQVRFQTLVDEVRFEVSRQLLETEMPIAVIAQSLQYANPGAYTRAFRRWSGTTPIQWRAASLSKQRQESGD